MLPPPLRGKAAAAADTWGPGLGGGAPSQPRERCPTRETHVMKPGEGGQVAPSLPGSGQTCLESQGRTRSSNPPTRSHLTQPAASLLLLSSPPHPPSALAGPPPPSSLPPPRPPHFSFTWLAPRRRRREHTPPVCAQSWSQRPRGHHARPQLKQNLKAAAPGSSSGFQRAQTQRNP